MQLNLSSVIFTSESNTYKFEKKPAHSHVWDISISQDGKMATAKCTEDGCEYTKNQEYTATIAATGKTYDGTAVTAEIAKGETSPFGSGLGMGNIKYAGRDGTSYAESETAPVNAGKYTASVIIGEGTTAKKIQVDYEITPASLTEDMVTITESAYEYDGNTKTPTVTVKKDASTTLTLNTDYTISGGSVTSASTLSTGNGYPVTVSGMENYTGTVTKYWKITKTQPVKSGELTIGALTYGQALSSSTITGEMQDKLDSAKKVAGTFAWKEPDTKPQVSDSNTTEYDIVFTPEDENYGETELKAKVTVNPKGLTVTADNKTRLVGAQNNPELTYTVTGLVGTDTKAAVFSGTLACTADQNSTVGQTYDITVGTLAVTNNNYTIGTFTKGIMTVSLPELKVDTIQPGELTSTTAKLNGSISPAAYATDANVSSVGFKYRKAGASAWENATGTVGGTFRAEVTGLTADSDYEYYAVMTVNGETTEKTGKTITFHTEKAVKTDTGKITVKVKKDGAITGTDTNVVVSVEKGNDVIASKDLDGVTTTESSVTFESLPDGNYNVVVSTKDGDFTETKMLSITNGEAVTADFTVLKGKIAAVVEIKEGTDTPKVAVDGLNDILDDTDKTNAANGTKEVEVKLDVEKKTEANASGSAEIKSLLSSKEEIGTYLDLSLFKTETDLSSGTAGTPVDIGNKNTKILCIAIPYVFTGRSGFFMARYHDRRKERMQKFDMKPVGTYESEGYFLDMTAGYIFLYAKGFSTYAIGYEKKSSSGSGYSVIPEYLQSPSPSPSVTPSAAPETTSVPSTAVASATPSVLPEVSTAPVTGVTAAPSASAVPAASPSAVPSSVPTDGAKETPSASAEPEDTAETEAVAVTAAEKKQAEFALNAGLKVVHNGTSATVKWGKVGSADFYKVYAAYCGNKKNELVKKVAAGKKLKVTFKKLYGKKLSTTKNIRVYVAAYRKAGTKTSLLTKSITAHVVGKKNTKYTNATKITLTKTSYAIKKGKSVTIKAKTVLQYPKRKQLGDAHAKEFRYTSTDKAVAAVNKKGKITAKKKGNCIIYIYARNGLAKEIKVAVK